MNATTDLLTSARAAALFASDVSTTEQPSRAQADAAIMDALRAYGGTRGCTAVLAAAYGDYPDLAPSRMRWARRVVATLYDRHARRAPELQREGDRYRTRTRPVTAVWSNGHRGGPRHRCLGSRSVGGADTGRGMWSTCRPGAPAARRPGRRGRDRGGLAPPGECSGCSE